MNIDLLKKPKTQRFAILHSNDMHGDFLAEVE
jgi:hypothetical protein